MPKGKNRSDPVVPASEPEVVVDVPVTVSLPYMTASFRITDFLNKKGISPVGASGNPLTFTYNVEHTEQIKKLIAEAGL